MVMLNDLDRFHLVIDVIDRVPGLGERAAAAAPGDGRRAAARPRLHARARRRLARGPRLDLARCGADRPSDLRQLGVRALRVLVVNAGSSSVKLCAARRPTTRRSRRASSRRRPTARPDALRRRSTAGWPTAPTRSGTASCTAASASASRCVIDAGVAAALRELTELAPLHQPKSLAALDAVAATLPGRARGRLLRHRLPRDAARGGVHLRAAARAGASAGACAATASTASRTPGSRGACRRAARLGPRATADRQLPPRRRRLAVRDRRRRARSTRRWASRRSRAW